MASSYSPSYNCSYALVVGIDHYQASDMLPPLNTATNDARAVADVLQKQYGFDVSLLLNEEATRSAIVESYEHLRASTRFDDRFVIYFAGHGIGLEGNVRVEGWLAAYDSDPQRRYRMVRMQDMSDPNLTAAKHALVILDTCHAGLALQFAPMRASASTARSTDEALRHFMTRRSYQVITSTDAKRTATDAGMLDDHTPFTGYLLRALQGKDLDACDPVTGLLTTSSVSQYIQSSMAVNFRDWQAPQLGTLPGDEGGTLIWEVPDQMEVIPERLRRALTSTDPDARYYALDRAVPLLDDPRIGAPLGRLLEDMATSDPDEDVRRKIVQLLRVGPPEPTPAPANVKVEAPPLEASQPAVYGEPPQAFPHSRPKVPPAQTPAQLKKGRASFVWASLRIALGWGISSTAFLVVNLGIVPQRHVLAYLANAIGGAVAGAVTLRGIQRMTGRAFSRETLLRTVGGWIVGWIFVDLVLNNTIAYYSSILGMVVVLLYGVISGVLVDFALRQIGKRTPTQTGVLISSWVAAWVVNLLVMLLIPSMLNLPIGWAMAGLIGGAASIWQAVRMQQAGAE